MARGASETRDEHLTVSERMEPRPGSAASEETAVGRPSLCMINYNGVRHLESSLKAVEAARQSFDEVLVVDDASTDESVDFVAERFPWVRVVRQARNGGAAAARNAGLEAATGDRVLFVDNDVRIPPDCAERLAEALAEHPEAAVAVPRCVYANRPDVVQFDGADAHFTGLQIVGPPDRPLDAAPTRIIGSLITACFFVDRTRLDRDLRFDEDFFIYLEDHDFGLQVRGRGRELIAVPDVVCLHGDGTEDLSIRLTGSYSKRRVFYTIRNRWLVVAKNYRLKTLVLLSPVLALFEAAQLAFVIKKGWLPQWLSGARWMLTHPGEVLAKRRAVLRDRVVSDGELLRGGPIPFRRELAKAGFEARAEALLSGVSSAYWSLVRRWI